MRLDEMSEQTTLNLLSGLFYRVVPLEFRTYCSLTTAISRAVLSELGIKSKAVPCQLWCATEDHNFVVGFLGKKEQVGKWDGHVICSTGGWFIDAALHHFASDFGIEVPSVAVVRRFTAQTQVIGRLDLKDQKTLWWHSPPVDARSRAPKEPQELVSEYAKKLVRELESLNRVDVESLALRIE